MSGRLLATSGRNSASAGWFAITASHSCRAFDAKQGIGLDATPEQAHAKLLPMMTGGRGECCRCESRPTRSGACGVAGPFAYPDGWQVPEIPPEEVAISTIAAN